MLDKEDQSKLTVLTININMCLISTPDYMLSEIEERLIN
jgi:hypothetical protein